MNVTISTVESVLNQDITVSEQAIRIGFNVIGTRALTYNPHTGLYKVRYEDYRMGSEVEEAFSGVDVRRAIEVYNTVSRNYLGVEE